ncbi:C10 family peptidase [bacterium]|nr:C10 family peptidase [bacterium]
MLFLSIVSAESVPPETIETTAFSLLDAHTGAGYNLGKRAPEGFGEPRTIGGIVPLIQNGETIAFVVNLEPCGYIAFSADYRIEPIIAFSYLCDFPFEEARGNGLLHMVLWDLASRKAAIPQTPQFVIEKNRRLWRELTDKYTLSAFEPSEIFGPYLDTHWDQGPPYNNLCPMDPETGDRCVVGCTATSMAQIINYWEYPTSAFFTTTESYWSDSTEPPIWIDASTATIDSIDYNGVGVHPNNDMKAAISWACGVSIWAIYGSEGTIAWFHDSSFVDKWGYLTAHKVDPPDMPDFYDSLRADMLEAKPAQLGIFTYEPDTSGHAIVCDGLMDSGEYHLNFGWGGAYDTWYRLPDDLPAPLTIMRWAIIDIRPPLREDAGNSRVEAISLEVPEEEAWRNDEFQSITDEDWYSFEVTGDSTYIFYSFGTTDTRAELYFEDSTTPVLVDDDSQDGINFRIIFHPDSAGTVYLRVTSTQLGLYSLRFYRVPAPFMLFTSPLEGDTVEEGASQIVRWDRGGTPSIPRIDLAFSLDGIDGPWTVFADSVPNSGLSIWAAPNVESSHHDCYIKVYEAATGRFETMTGPFSLIDLAGIIETTLPEKIAISAYPNPFNATVNISVNGSAGEGLAPSRVEIFDIAGRRVAQLPSPSVPLQGGEEGGSFSLWEKVAEGRMRAEFIWQPDAAIGSGIYLIRATIPQQTTSAVCTKRVVYLK